MVDYKITQSVHKRKKKSTKIIQGVIVVLGVLFLFMAVAFTTGFMMFVFLTAAMYFIFEQGAQKDYEYSYEDDIFTVDVLKANRKHVREQELNMNKLEVVAPHYHEAVSQYRKDTGSIKLAKYDYTSYDDSIPYYTMIIMTEEHDKIKLLLDLNDEMLQAMKRKYPQKVYL